MAAALTIEIEEIAQRADALKDEIRAGRRLELVEDGHRIAEIVPCGQVLMGEEREAAWRELQAMMEKGFHLGGLPYKNRDELYERD